MFPGEVVRLVTKVWLVRGRKHQNLPELLTLYTCAGKAAPEAHSQRAEGNLKEQAVRSKSSQELRPVHSEGKMIPESWAKHQQCLL